MSRYYFTMKQKKAAIRSIGHIKMHLFPILSVIYPVKIIPIKDPISNIPYNKIINLRLNYFNFQILYYLKSTFISSSETKSAFFIIHYLIIIAIIY